ncbi:hypothetical protein ACOMHN_063228 [Nucella lapillus]
MKNTAILGCLLLACVAMVIGDEEPEPPNVPLPYFTSIEVETLSQRRGAQITARYMAPENTFTMWFVNGLPIQAGRVGYFVYNIYNNSTRQGRTKMSTMYDKRSQFAACLQSVSGEVCLFLAAPFQDSGVQRQEVHFIWPLMTPGPLARYNEGEKLKIHAPLLATPYNYTYTASLYSKNPDHNQGRLVQAQSEGMEGGDGIVTISPVTGGKGWLIEVDTDDRDYEGVLLINTTYTSNTELVRSCEMYRSFSIYRKDHAAPFVEGFVAPIPSLITWQCRLGVECMVYCPFVSNGQVRVSISRAAINSVLAEERRPDEPEVRVATIRMLGPYMGYGYIFIPSFTPSEDAGIYECIYTTDAVRVAGMVTVV